MPILPEDYGTFIDVSRDRPTLSSVQPVTNRQNRLWTQIIDAAVEAATTGGYSDVSMREIARSSGVSMSTVYFYFPSKVHLLTAALIREIADFSTAVGQYAAGIADPFDRLVDITHRLTDAMSLSARVTDALTHAYAVAYVLAIDEGDQVRRQTVDLFNRHLEDLGPCRDTISEMLGDVWTCGILSLVQGRTTLAALQQRLETTIDLLKRNWPNHIAECVCGAH